MKEIFVKILMENTCEN